MISIYTTENRKPEGALDTRALEQLYNELKIKSETIGLAKDIIFQVNYLSEKSGIKQTLMAQYGLPRGENRRALINRGLRILENMEKDLIKLEH